MYTLGGSFNITSSTFTNNTAARWGGVLYTISGSVNITSSNFINNTAASSGGVMCTFGGSFNITSSTFTNNTAASHSGVMYTDHGRFTIMSSNFTNNTAAVFGGFMNTFGGLFNIMSSNFTSNRADVGGVIWSQDGSFSINNSSFNNNTADSYGVIMFTNRCLIHITDSTFHYNTGSLYTFNGNLTVSGQSMFENCVESTNKTSDSLTFQEGGAVTSFQSTVTFHGETSLLNNQARQGGAILVIESRIMFNGAVTIANNTATDSNLNSAATNSYGGGISLQQSQLEIKRSCTVSDNYAMRGGGVHAKGSTITVHQLGTLLQVVNNNAEKGGGMYLEVNPKVYLLKINLGYKDILIFNGNQASYGGAVYMADDINAGACSPNVECFIQTLAFYYYEPRFITDLEDLHFSGNTATDRGSNLFGGLLDRCVPSSFSEVYRKQQTYEHNITLELAILEI